MKPGCILMDIDFIKPLEKEKSINLPVATIMLKYISHIKVIWKDLTLKALITNAADKVLIIFLFRIFQRK